ncbi:transcriptional regulator with XRE-family HTH domain [Pseudonocardia alni]|uniref:Transcriptional regulator with XRE-family HTH domain n=1 Tax=Pseudonocardia alni TaxID=33907 RepID=A0AA44UNS9_PSEA5|nr:transcriptional regulator with XRE-family HTH domain [Pseudonocardia alni]
MVVTQVASTVLTLRRGTDRIGRVHAPPPSADRPSPARPGTGAALRAARDRRGWSQSEAARALAALVAGSGGTARAASLKTQLSRWENGHAVPDAAHRALLAELYDSTPAGLGLADATGPDPLDGAARLRAALERAAAVGEEELDLLRAQWAATTALDDRLGTAAAHDAVAAVVAQLREPAAHARDPRRVRALTGLLAAAALRLGDQERDRAAPDRAWAAYVEAESAALRAGDPGTADEARHRRERLLAELPAVDAQDGAPDPVGAHGATGRRATTSTGAAGPGDAAPGGEAGHSGGTGRAGPGPCPTIDVHTAPAWLTVADGPPQSPVRERTDLALDEVLAALRDGDGPAARAAHARARALALRSGSQRVLDRLATLPGATPP